MKRLALVIMGLLFFILSASSIELENSRFELGSQSILLKEKTNYGQGTVINFRQKTFEESKSDLKPIDIDQETLVYLPKGVKSVEYTEKDYSAGDFATQIQEHMFKGFPYYGLLFVLAALASL